MMNCVNTALRRLAAIIAMTLLLVSCGVPEKAEAPAPAAPTDAIQALMLTYETVLGPENRSVRFQVASDGTFVRLGNETENWRLFDTKNQTIVFVDKAAGTATEVSFEAALAERTSLLAGASDAGIPTASIVEGPGEPERGHPTHRVKITVGSFSREILLSTDLLLPGEFFAMKIVTDPVDARYAAIVKDVLPVLVRQNGTLLSETNRLDIENGEPVTATTRLVSVTTVQLSRKTFAVPDNITITKKETVAPEATTPKPQ